MIKKKFVVYEVWTRSRVIEAESHSAAYLVGEPVVGSAAPDMSLCNWHIQSVDGTPEPVTDPDMPPAISGGLNFRQES